MSVSLLVVRLWARSARDSPSWSGCPRATTAGWPSGRARASPAAWPSSSCDRSGIEKRRPSGPTNVIGMSLIIHNTFLPADDPEKSLSFYRDVLGFEVRGDVAYGDMRWITVGPPDQPQTS